MCPPYHMSLFVWCTRQGHPTDTCEQGRWWVVPTSPLYRSALLMALQSLANALFKTSGNLSVKSGAATKHTMPLLLPKGKHNCGQHPHTLTGEVCGSRVFAMIFLLPLKRLAKVCWAMLLEWTDEIMRSNS